MEGVDELCQDANKFNNHLRNVARQQQQKDAYIQRRVNSLFSLFNKEIISSVPHGIALIVGCTKLLSFKYCLFSSKHFVLCKTVILFAVKDKSLNPLSYSFILMWQVISFRIFLAKWECYTAYSRRTSFTRGGHFQDIQTPTVAITPWLPSVISASKHIQCTSEPIFNSQLWKAVPFTSAAGKWKIDVCRYVSNKIKLCHDP